MVKHLNKLGLLLLPVVICILAQTANAQVDETVQERAFGQDVSEAVLRRIDASTLFKKDHSFLTRLAYVESKFGTENKTYRDEYYGGIWQVEESVFRITQTNHIDLAPLHVAIKNRFGIDWTKLKWSDLVVPLHSGLAAALYFTRVPEPIPDTISGQAEHWRKWYRPLGNVSKFIEDSEDLRNQTTCRGKMDLCIVLDSSGSINQWNPGNYNKAKDFTAEMIESFTLDYNRIGMLIYSTTVRDIFRINNTLQISQMANQARNAPYLKQGTRTDLAITRAAEMFAEVPANEGVPRLLFVFTDGNSDTGSNVTGAVQTIRNMGIKSVAVGIGTNINRQELELIAMNDNSSVFMLTDFQALQDFLFEITAVACETPQRPVLNATVDDQVIKNEKRLYQLEIPEEGITVKVTETVGKTNGYWSWTEKVPSSAVHDGKISGPTYIPPPPSSSSKAMRLFAEEPEPEEPASVFITIQGVEEKNNYTLVTSGGISEEVTTAPPTTTTTTTTEAPTTEEETDETKPEQTTRPTETTTKGGAITLHSSVYFTLIITIITAFLK